MHACTRLLRQNLPAQVYGNSWLFFTYFRSSLGGDGNKA